jgi:hypothetical protein
MSTTHSTWQMAAGTGCWQMAKMRGICHQPSAISHQPSAVAIRPALSAAC